MTQLIDKMRSELRGIMSDAVHTYPFKPREKFLFDYPSQACMIGGCTTAAVCGHGATWSHLALGPHAGQHCMGKIKPSASS